MSRKGLVFLAFLILLLVVALGAFGGPLTDAFHQWLLALHGH